MQQVLLTRASTLAAFTDLLRDMGAPVDRELSRWNLPTGLDPSQNGFVPVMPSLMFVRQMERKEQVDDIVFRALDRGPKPNLSQAPFIDRWETPRCSEPYEAFAILFTARILVFNSHYGATTIRPRSLSTLTRPFAQTSCTTAIGPLCCK